MTEIWKDIIGYEGLYQVSNYGNIYSLPKYYNPNGKMLKPVITECDYHCVTLHKAGKQKRVLIHRLVAVHFIPNPSNKPQVNHKDTIKINNHVENLEWATTFENMHHAYANNLIFVKGIKNGGSKLKNEHILEIRQKYKGRGGIKMRELGKQYGVATSVISNIINRLAWSHI